MAVVLQDIERDVGTSVSTVSRTLNARVCERMARPTQERLRRAAERPGRRIRHDLLLAAVAAAEHPTWCTWPLTSVAVDSVRLAALAMSTRQRAMGQMMSPVQACTRRVRASAAWRGSTNPNPDDQPGE